MYKKGSVVKRRNAYPFEVPVYQIGMMEVPKALGYPV